MKEAPYPFIEEFSLEKQKYMARHRQDSIAEERIKRDGQFDIFEDAVRQELVRSLMLEVWRESDKEVCVGEAPSDWWQAVKERFAPAWFKRKWPVQKTKFTAKASFHYPNYSPKMPEEEHRLRMYKVHPPRPF